VLPALPPLWPVAALCLRQNPRRFGLSKRRGAIVYSQKCAKCHYPTTTHGLHGPGLQALTKVKAMPSGAPPTDERLTQTILRGRATMPGTQLTDDQLSDLLAYLHTL
jgi:mono/diheme cytochrome c family protein